MTRETKKVDGKFKQRFELDGKYSWDWTDLIALVYVAGTAATIAGAALAGTIILWIGALINLIAVLLLGRRLNLILIGLTIAILDTYFLIVAMG